MKKNETSANAEKKQKDHLFKKGQSGNPAGKKCGTRNKATMAAQELLDGESEKLTRKCIKMALDGDITALRLCLSRLVPPAKERPISLDLDLSEESTAEMIDNASRTIMQAVAKGQITPGEGVALSSILEKRRQSLETLEFEERLAKLEKNQEKK